MKCNEICFSFFLVYKKQPGFTEQGSNPIARQGVLFLKYATVIFCVVSSFAVGL